MITLKLPYPPSVNHIYNNRKGGGKYLKPEVKKYRRDVKIYVLQQHPGLHTIMDNVELDIKLYIPDKKTRDIDNILKSLLDAITKSDVWKDDSQIFKLTIEKNFDNKYGGVEVLIKKYGG